MLATFDRHLKERDYMYSITRDWEFYQSKLVLEGKVKHLRQLGKGTRPNAASALTSNEEGNTMDSKNSRRFQSRSYFSDDVVESN